MRERLLAINPSADIEIQQERYSDDRHAEFRLEDYDFILDAIDSLSDKASLILRACMTPATFFSSMGAALKTDPTKVRVAEFMEVRGCPSAPPSARNSAGPAPFRPSPSSASMTKKSSPTVERPERTRRCPMARRPSTAPLPLSSVFSVLPWPDWSCRIFTSKQILRSAQNDRCHLTRSGLAAMNFSQLEADFRPASGEVV